MCSFPDVSTYKRRRFSDWNGHRTPSLLLSARHCVLLPGFQHVTLTAFTSSIGMHVAYLADSIQSLQHIHFSCRRHTVNVTVLLVSPVSLLHPELIID
jgi:hypothetical protein